MSLQRLRDTRQAVLDNRHRADSIVSQRCAASHSKWQHMRLVAVLDVFGIAQQRRT